jgi:4a-hydroxytetrahydrobiopterin dehydratase
MASLNDSELHSALADLAHWHLADGKLVRDFTFPDFVAALDFVNRVGSLAEAQNPHPDIDIRYNKVRLGLISHDANGITRRDLRLAALLNTEFPVS